jgi:hypothetical protein
MLASGQYLDAIGFNILQQNKIEELKADVQWFQEVFRRKLLFRNPTPFYEQ